MNTFKKLNEQLQKFIINENNTYKVTVLVNQDRMYSGDVETATIDADNDLQALYNAFTQYDIQNKYTLIDPEEELDDEQLELRNNILQCLRDKDLKTGIKLLTDLYFDGFDPSDYDDKIISVENPQGKIIFEDEDLQNWLEDTEDLEDEDAIDDVGVEDDHKDWYRYVEYCKQESPKVWKQLQELQNKIQKAGFELMLDEPYAQTAGSFICQMFEHEIKSHEERIGFIDYDFDMFTYKCKFRAHNEQNDTWLNNADFNQLEDWLFNQFVK